MGLEAKTPALIGCGCHFIKIICLLYNHIDMICYRCCLSSIKMPQFKERLVKIFDLKIVKHPIIKNKIKYVLLSRILIRWFLQLRMYCWLHRKRQLSSWSFHVVHKGLLFPLLKDMTRHWERMCPQCILVAFPPTLKAVHLWWDPLGQILKPDENSVE